MVRNTARQKQCVVFLEAEFGRAFYKVIISFDACLGAEGHSFSTVRADV
jgi:hypothetical protein